MNRKELVALILLPFFLAGTIIYTDMMGRAFGETHYLGDVVITNSQQKDTLITEITSNADYGDFNMWKPAYNINTADNGTILHYAFFSKNKSIADLTKAK